MTKWLHRLSNIQGNTADCSNCGKVKIKLRKGSPRCYYSDRYGSANSANIRSDNCEICGRVRRLYFDHDHATGSHRGWICARCNTLLGMAQDNIQILEKAIVYLSK